MFIQCRASPNRRCPAGRARAHLCSAAFFRCDPANIGRQGAAILVRVMGIILCSLTVEIVLTTLGVANWAPVPR
jgi:hypothetical protein